MSLSPSLGELRKRIDETDTKIVRLIAERVRIAKVIGEEKKKQGKQIKDVVREQAILKNVRSIAQEEDISQEGIEEIYRQIVTMSKSAQVITNS